jgi:hypothetical protein
VRQQLVHMNLGQAREATTRRVQDSPPHENQYTTLRLYNARVVEKPLVRSLRRLGSCRRPDMTDLQPATGDLASTRDWTYCVDLGDQIKANRNKAKMLRKLRRVAIFGITLTLSLIGTADIASAGSYLPPINTIHGAPFPSAGLQSQDSCSSNQYNNTNLPSIDRVVLRGFRVNLLSPLSWACQIGDGNGSGATVTIAKSTPSPSATRDSIMLVSSANVLDNGGDFCAYTRANMPSWSSEFCRGRRERPSNEEVEYLHGGPNSKSFVVLVAVPAGVTTPWIGQVAKEPTVTVLAASAASPGAFDLVCSVGTTISPICITDAKQFAAAYWSQS